MAAAAATAGSLRLHPGGVGDERRGAAAVVVLIVV